MPNQYSIPNAEDVRGILKSVAPAWRFLAIMPEIDQQVGSNYSFSANGGAANSSAPKLSKPQLPNAVCESVEIPPVTIDVDQRFGGGTKISVPRFISSGMLTLNFYEDEEYNITKYLWAWHLMVADGSNLFGLPKDYKKNISVWAFDNQNNYAPVFMVDFIECWPTNPVGGLSYSQSNNGFLTVSCEFTIDDQEMQFLGSTKTPRQKANEAKRAEAAMRAERDYLEANPDER